MSSYSFLQSAVTPTLLRPDIARSALFSENRNPSFSVVWTDQK